MDVEKKKRRRHRKKKHQNVDYTFELVLADGRAKKFTSGKDMYNWAATVNKDWTFPEWGSTNIKTFAQWREDQYKKRA